MAYFLSDSNIYELNISGVLIINRPANTFDK